MFKPVGVAYTRSAKEYFAIQYWDALNHYYWGPFGVITILEQEGIPFRILSDKDLEDTNLLKKFEAIILSDQPYLTEKQEEAIRKAHQNGVGLILDGVTGWIDPEKIDFREIGRIVPLRENPQLADIQGLFKVNFDYSFTKHLVRIFDNNHLITHLLETSEERSFPIKYLPVMETRNIDSHAIILGELLHPAEVAGTGRGSIIIYQDSYARTVTFTFPAARWFRYKINNPLDPERDSDLITYPIDCSSDSIRLLFACSIQWASRSQILIKKYYWPRINGIIPKAVIATSSDLCGGTDYGVKAVKKICSRYNAKHTFMDGPRKFYMNRDNVGVDDVALHVSDYIDLETIKSMKRELEKLIGCPVKGWGRHGSTKLLNYPGVWQKAVDTGFEWTRFMYIQTAEETKDAPTRELESPGNRLPYYGFNPLYGRFEDIIEIPMFDTTDDIDHLLIEYSHRNSWDKWMEIVKRRLKIHVNNHVICSYQIHGWVAGAGAGEPFEETGWRAIPGWRKRAENCLKMLEYFLDFASKNKLPTMTGTEINDWWRKRHKVKIDIEFLPPIINLEINNINEERIDRFVLQICLPDDKICVEEILVESVPADFETWVESNYKKILIPLDLDSGVTHLKIKLTKISHEETV